MKDDKLYLIHIRECIARIETYTKEGKDVFFRDAKTQDAVLRNFQTLSESITRLSQVLKDNYPAIDWRSIAAFRNIVVHEYLGIDFKQVWDIVKHDLPVLKENIESLLLNLGE